MASSPVELNAKLSSQILPLGLAPAQGAAFGVSVSAMLIGSSLSRATLAPPSLSVMRRRPQTSCPDQATGFGMTKLLWANVEMVVQVFAIKVVGDVADEISSELCGVLPDTQLIVSYSGPADDIALASPVIRPE